MRMWMLMGALLLGTASASSLGAVMWLAPEQPEDAPYSALVAENVAQALNWLEPHLATTFMSPMFMPDGPQNPFDVLYGSESGMRYAPYAEQAQIAREALGVPYALSGVVGKNQATLYVASWAGVQTLSVQADQWKLPEAIRAALAKKFPVKPTPLPTAEDLSYGEALITLGSGDWDAVMEQFSALDTPVAQAMFARLQNPELPIDVLYQRLATQPDLALNSLANVPLANIDIMRAVLQWQTGATQDAYASLQGTRLMYAKAMLTQLKALEGEEDLVTLQKPRGVLPKVLAALLYKRVPALADQRIAAADALPNSVFLLTNASYSALGNNDFVKAKDLLEKLVVLQPDSAKYWANLGWTEFELGNTQKAIQNSLQAINLDDKYAIAYYNLGLFYALEGIRDQALNYYSAGLEYGNRDNWKEAVADLENQAPEMQIYRALLLEQGGEYLFAKKALSVYPNNDTDEYAKELANKIVGNEWSNMTVAIENVPEVVQGLSVLKPKIRIRSQGYLPESMWLNWSILDGDKKVLDNSKNIPINPALIGYTVQDINIILPKISASTAYLYVKVNMKDGRVAETKIPIRLEGEVDSAGKIAGLNVQWVNVAGEPLEKVNLLDTFKQQVLGESNVATNYIPEAPPRFNGQTANEIFKQVTAEDILAALDYMLAHENAFDLSQPQYFPIIYAQYLIRAE